MRRTSRLHAEVAENAEKGTQPCCGKGRMMKETGLAIIAAGLFVGAAIMFAGGIVAQAINSNYGGNGLAGGVIFLIAGALGLLLLYRAEVARKKQV